MIVSIHQPAYLPWLGYFDKIKKADLFLYLDTVQFQKNSFQNRNKIRTSTGSLWLTVPVKHKNHFSETLQHLHINNETNWRIKHQKTLETNYCKAPNFKDVCEWLMPYYARTWVTLSELCFQMLTTFLEKLDIQTPVRRTSELSSSGSQKSNLILDLCKQCGATTYLSGSLGRNYLDENSFLDHNIKILYQDYSHPHYHQVYPDFEPYMGIVDLMMCSENPAGII